MTTMKNTLKVTGILTFLLLVFIPSVLAEEEDILVLGVELEELIGFVAGLIALILFFITFLAYARDGRRRYLYIAIAFFLFAVKNFLDSSALFFDEIEIFGPVAVALELVIILLFFYALIKKGE